VSWHPPLLSAQLSGRASQTQICAGCAFFLEICRHLKLRVWGFVWETACALPTWHTFLPKLPPTAPISTPRAPSEPENYKLSNGVLRSRNGAVAASYALRLSMRGLFGHIFALKKGDSVGDDPLPSWSKVCFKCFRLWRCCGSPKQSYIIFLWWCDWAANWQKSLLFMSGTLKYPAQPASKPASNRQALQIACNGRAAEGLLT